MNIFASKGDAVSVFEIDSAHKMGIAFHIAGFTPSFVKFPRSAMYDTELGKVKSDAGKILITETLILNPDSSKGLLVSIKVEKVLNASSYAGTKVSAGIISERERPKCK